MLFNLVTQGLILTICCLLLCLSACTKDEMIEQYNKILQTIGDISLSKDKELQGNRNFGQDNYVGTYDAEYSHFSGQEILFGGTALERKNSNNLQIKYNSIIKDGSCKLILKTGAAKPKTLFDSNGSYFEMISLPSASNYIILEMNNFSGSISLIIK